MNYESMAYRELDSLVAEKVMGWSRQSAYESADTAKPFPWFAVDDDPDSVEFGSVDLRRMDTAQWEYGWEPSRKIESAFEVVEAMRERDGLNVEIASLPEDNGWKVEFFSFPRVGASIDKSLPRAICIAALRTFDE